MKPKDAKSPQKETKTKKENKQPVSQNLSNHSQNGQNKYKTITDAKYETKPILTKAQKKKLQIENQKQFIQQQRTNRTKKSTRLNHSKQLIQHRQYTPKLGICKSKQTKNTQEPNQVNEPMHQRQPSSNNANTTNKPLVQTEGNHKQRETETREPVSGNQVSESGKTGPLNQ
ncbi:Hypothetical_protein [Hexamita inflata]|uniref:Hypothetical_protein n=1 Tax=Hexamita inflata TaxID=28002 RepID=A0AA86P7C5_9EUKA|nr:Hypothetical protein HINF_LOCUS19360 [Hexamita inflata]